MEVKSYKDLVVWQKGMSLVEEIYRLQKLLPKEEKFAIGDQMRRAAVSIPSNIAEGWGRASTKEYLNFLSIANGSYCELETQLDICRRTGIINEEELEQALSLSDEIGKMLSSMIKKLR